MSEDVTPYGARPDTAARVEEFRALLAELELSQREAGELLEVDQRTVRYWAAANPPPPIVAIYALRYLATVKRARGGDVAAGSMSRVADSSAPPNVVYKKFVDDDEQTIKGNR